jgi:hypothetical protein
MTFRRRDLTQDAIEAIMILSDTSIAAGLANGRFIEGGDQAFVGPCSYQFCAGKIFTGGEPVNIVDWI